MLKLNEILNLSDSLSEESSAPSSLSLDRKGTGSTDSENDLTSKKAKDVNIEELKKEPKEGLAEKVKEEIEEDLEKRNAEIPDHLPRSKVNKKLISKKLVQIAIRRKSLSKDAMSNMPHNSKLHIKSLEAGLRVKLTLAPSLVHLYNSLTPHTNRQRKLFVFNSNDEQANVIHNDNYLNEVYLTTKPVQLIDNNLVNLSVFSNKLLKTIKNGKAHVKLPTFNSLNTAVKSLFNVNEFSLVRISRSTTVDSDGSQLLKFETAKPGEFHLIDDNEYLDEYLHSIGKPGETPSNLFIKKIIARPRYKSDMKIYLIPKDCNASLYVDKRMFERDLINGVIDTPFYKNIYCTFEFDEALNQFHELVKLSEQAENKDQTPLPQQSNEYYGSNPQMQRPNYFNQSNQMMPILSSHPSYTNYQALQQLRAGGSQMHQMPYLTHQLSAGPRLPQISPIQSSSSSTPVSSSNSGLIPKISDAFPPSAMQKPEPNSGYSSNSIPHFENQDIKKRDSSPLNDL